MKIVWQMRNKLGPFSAIERHNWVEEAKTGEQSKLVVMPKRGLAPSMEKIVASVALPEEPALTVVGD